MKFLTLFLLLSLSTNVFSQSSSKPLKIMSYNIRGGLSMSEIRNLNNASTIISTINADIVALQEIDSITIRNGLVNTVEMLSQMTGMHGVFGRAIDFDGGGYGVALLSKVKPIAVKRFALPGREEKRVLLMAEFDDFIFLVTHLSLTSEDQTASLAIIADIAAKCDKPLFLAGDLNFSPLDGQYAEFEKSFLNLSGIAPTFPANKPSVCIDYIGIWRNGRHFATATTAEVINAPFQSDHRPVVASVNYGDIVRTIPYLQNPTNGGITVCWQTNAPCHSYVEYGTDTTNLTRVTPLIEGQADVNTSNKVRLGVESGKRYFYRTVSQHITHYGPYQKLYGGKVTSPFYSFALPSGNDFTALIINDLHQRKATIDTLVSMIKSKAVEYDYIVFNGDCIDDPNSLEQALATIQYFNTKLGCSSIPTIYIRGNHEIRGAFSVEFNSIVDYPGGEHCYGAFNLGATRVVILDSGEDKPDTHPAYFGLNDFAQYRADQTKFLQAELSSNAFKNAKNRVLIHHIPLYGQPEEWKNLASDYWCSTLTEAPFDIAINGHTHEHKLFKKGEVGNNFPIAIGGGYQIESATAMVLTCKKNKIALKCFNSGGELLFEVK